MSTKVVAAQKERLKLVGAGKNNLRRIISNCDQILLPEIYKYNKHNIAMLRICSDGFAPFHILAWRASVELKFELASKLPKEILNLKTGRVKHLIRHSRSPDGSYTLAELIEQTAKDLRILDMLRKRGTIT